MLPSPIFGEKLSIMLSNDINTAILKICISTKIILKFQYSVVLNIK